MQALNVKLHSVTLWWDSNGRTLTFCRNMVFGKLVEDLALFVDSHTTCLWPSCTLASSFLKQKILSDSWRRHIGWKRRLWVAGHLPAALNKDLGVGKKSRTGNQGVMFTGRKTCSAEQCCFRVKACLKRGENYEIPRASMGQWRSEWCRWILTLDKALIPLEDPSWRFHSNTVTLCSALNHRMKTLEAQRDSGLIFSKTASFTSTGQ